MKLVGRETLGPHCQDRFVVALHTRARAGSLRKWHSTSAAVRVRRLSAVYYYYYFTTFDGDSRDLRRKWVTRPRRRNFRRAAEEEEVVARKVKSGLRGVHIERLLVKHAVFVRQRGRVVSMYSLCSRTMQNETRKKFIVVDYYIMWWLFFWSSVCPSLHWEVTSRFLYILLKKCTCSDVWIAVHIIIYVYCDAIDYYINIIVMISKI